jgi:hypothetical protein
MSKQTSYNKIYRPNVRARPHLPRRRDFTHRRFLLSALIKIRLRRRSGVSTWTHSFTHSLPSPPPSRTLPCPPFQTQSAVRVDADADARKQIKKFGIQSPRSPSSAGEAARRRRFFRPSSPSHPSKLYSSLGLLNSKVPKPFSPFSLRLIDIDGF